MAVSFTGCGTATAASGASPQAVTTTAALAVGDVLVALVAYDNSGTNGADPMTGTIALAPATGAVGASVSAQTGLNDPGAASAGVAARCVAFPVTTAIPSGTSVNVSWTGTVVVRAVVFEKVTSAQLTMFVANSGAAGTNQAASTTIALTTPSVTNGDGVLCWAAHEYGEAITGDADTTNGSWSAVVEAHTGTTTSGIGACFQSKVVTATATQAFNPTGTSSDWIAGALVFTESPWAVTVLASASASGSEAQTAVTSSFTPAVGKLYVDAFGLSTSTGIDLTVASTTLTDSGGAVVFTRIFQDTQNSADSEFGRMARFEATVGTSPTAGTVTLDAGASTKTAWISYAVFQPRAAAAGTPQIKSGQIIGNRGAGAAGTTVAGASGTLPAAATTGNLSMIAGGRNNDTTGLATVPASGGFAATATFDTGNTTFASVCAFQSTTFTGTSTSIPDFGGQTSCWSTILAEWEVATAGQTGTIAVTEDADTSAAAGVSTHTGTIAVAEAADTVAAAGALTHVATMAWTAADDTTAIVGVSTHLATVAVTEADDTSAIAAASTHVATIAATEADDTVAAAGYTPNDGPIIFTEDADTAAAAGISTHVATIVYTEADDTTAAAGAITRVATAAWTEDDDLMVAAGSSTDTGAVVWVEDDDTLTASGSSGADKVGTIAVTETDDTIAASATSTHVATVAWSEDADTSTAAGAATHVATTAWTEDADTLAAAGSSGTEKVGTIGYTEAADTVAATGQSSHIINAAWTDDPDTSTIAGRATHTATAIWTEADDAFLAAASITRVGELAWSENPDTMAGEGNQGFPPLGGSSSGATTTNGSAGGVTVNGSTGATTVNGSSGDITTPTSTGLVTVGSSVGTINPPEDS